MNPNSPLGIGSVHPTFVVMKKDITITKVTDVKVAVGKAIDEKGESDWYVYIINNKPVELNNVMVVSSASENADGSGKKTSTLRHMIESLPATSSAKVERIDPAIFSFYNTFWMSFYIGREIFDKKFTISPFTEWELEPIAELGMDGKLAE